MSFDSLSRREVPTRTGMVPLWSRPDIFAPGSRPVVVGIQGLLAGDDDLSRLPDVMGRVADAAVLRLGGLGGTRLDEIAAAAGEVIARVFPQRPVVLLGVSIAGVAALAARAPSLRRIVAVEPPLVTGGLWPLAGPVRAHLGGQPAASRSRALFLNLFGLSETEAQVRDYRGLLDDLAVPADVILGQQPLAPERRVAAFPSLVDEAARAALARSPRVRLHLAPGAGHNIQAQAPKVLREVVQEACRRAAAEPAYEVRGLDEPLVEAAPLTARRVLHWGPAGPAFAGAYTAWNPAAEVRVLGEDPAAAPEAGGFDLLALGAPPPPSLLTRLTQALAPEAALVARWASGAALPAEARAALAGQGFHLRAPVDEGGTGVFRATRAAKPAPPPLRLEVVAFASYLMDVRTRLPTRGLRSDPDLDVAYAIAPHTPLDRPVEQPKVLLLQRPGPMEEAAGRRLMAYAMARRWVVVLEYDDHPRLVAEALGRTYTEQELIRFGYAHAVQTTTEPLARAFAPYNPEVRIFENAVFELAPFRGGERPRRVFYGAISRGGFGVEVARAMGPVVARFPDVEFEVLGDRAVFDALPTERKRFQDYLPYEAYLARMAECAISLSPIEALPGRDTKSDAKFLDAARAGVVTIASPLIYDRVIRHGENGLLAPRLEDWAPLTLLALAEPDFRERMARTAWEEMRRVRMFAGQVARRRDWYRDLWARRADLDAAAVARIPGLAEALAAERAALSARK